MQLNKVRRISSQLLGAGESKVWFNPEQLEEISQAMTKEDIRGLINAGAIKKRKEKQQSRGRARMLHLKKKKGRKRGRGKRTGRITARMGKKNLWIKNVRAQRRTLKELRKKVKFKKKEYSTIYRQIKGGLFKGKKYVEQAAKVK